MIANTVSAFTLGKMAANTKATGSTASNTVTVSTAKTMGKKDEASGRKANALLGWMSQIFRISSDQSSSRMTFLLYSYSPTHKFK